jgi:hypothetical protein
MPRASVLPAVLLALAAGPAPAQEMVENGEFTAWHKFKKGTAVTTRMTSTAAGMSSEVTMTMTLLDVGPDKLVLEAVGVTKAMGMEFKMPAVKRDVPKTVALPKGAPKPPAPGSKPEGTYEEGTETLKVGGTEVKSRWYKFKNEMGGVKSDAKMWISEDMPGMMVKMEATTTGTVASETRMEVVEVKKP